MPPTVKPITNVVCDADVAYAPPLHEQRGAAAPAMFSTCRAPLLQTPPMPFTLAQGGKTGTFMCSEPYADAVGAVEEHAIDVLACNSMSWFNRQLSVDDVEQMMKSPIKGHRVPKHTVACRPELRCYQPDASGALVPCDAPADGALCVGILQLQGVRIDAKRCELNFVLHQLKVLPAEEQQGTTELTLEDAAFI